MRKEFNKIMEYVELLPEMPHHDKNRTNQMLYDIYCFITEEGTTTEQDIRLVECGIRRK